MGRAETGVRLRLPGADVGGAGDAGELLLGRPGRVAAILDARSADRGYGHELPSGSGRAGDYVSGRGALGNVADRGGVLRLSYTINSAKEAAISAMPVFLFDFVWADGSTLSVCSHPLTWDGTFYEARVLQQSIDPIQALSPHGIEIPGAVKLTLADADKGMWAIEQSNKFRGARLTVTFVFYDFESGDFSTDSLVPFVGRVDQPEAT